MLRWLRVALVPSAAAAAWLLLSPWLPSPSERFYLLVPPAALGLFLPAAPRPWARCREQAVRAAGFAVGLTAFAALYGLMLATAADGVAPPLAAEIAIAAYFLLAVACLVLGVWFLLKAGCGRLAAALFGTAPSRVSTRAGRALLAEVLPLVVLGLLSLPYLMGLSYVHRIKIPNGASPQQFDRPYEDVEFTTADGLVIRGWFVPAAGTPSARTVIVCHGIGANRSQFLGYKQVADALGANVLFFDFRGHGASDGHTVTLGYREKLDVLAAIAYLRSERPEQARELIGLGVSMGGSGLVDAASEVEPPLDAVVLDSTFAVAVDVTDSILGGVPAALRPALTVPGVPLASLHAGCPLDEVRPVDRIANVRAPLLIVHCEDDRLIPVEHARRMYRAAAEPKTLLTAHAGGHCHVLHGANPQYLQAVVKLLPPR